MVSDIRWVYQKAKNLGGYSRVNFEFGLKTDIYESCSVEYKNKFFVFGGYYEQRQVTRVVDTL